MPPIVPALTTLGGAMGASAATATAAGAVIAAGTGASIYGAYSDNKNQKKNLNFQKESRKQSQDYIERMTKQARADIFKLFPQAQESRQKGLEASMGMLSQTLPAQFQTFGKGNMNAQDTLIQGGQRSNNAILGNPLGQGYQSKGIDLAGMGQQMGIQAPVPLQFAPITDTQQQPRQGGIQQPYYSQEEIDMMNQGGY
jgi:hypothetical protein